MVINGLNVELTSVYWLPCPSACRHPVLLRSLTNVDKFYVVSSMPFDRTGHHLIQHVLIVATHNRTSVRLALPQSAGDESTPGSRFVELDAFQSFAVELRQPDLTGLSVEATNPVFVSASLSSKLGTPWPNIKDLSTPPESSSSVQNEHISSTRFIPEAHAEVGNFDPRRRSV